MEKLTGDRQKSLKDIIEWKETIHENEENLDQSFFAKVSKTPLMYIISNIKILIEPL
jgi:hypothetical protein